MGHARLIFFNCAVLGPKSLTPGYSSPIRKGTITLTSIELPFAEHSAGCTL